MLKLTTQEIIGRWYEIMIKTDIVRETRSQEWKSFMCLFSLSFLPPALCLWILESRILQFLTFLMTKPVKHPSCDYLQTFLSAHSPEFPMEISFLFEQHAFILFSDAPINLYRKNLLHKLRNTIFCTPDSVSRDLRR